MVRILSSAALLSLFLAFPVLAKAKTKAPPANFAQFTAKERAAFNEDVAPIECKETTKTEGSKSYEGCFVNGKPFYIRMLDEGTPWGVLRFRGGEVVAYEGIENPELRLIKKGELYALYNADAKTVRTVFADAEGKELVGYTRKEVAAALKAFKLPAK